MAQMIAPAGAGAQPPFFPHGIELLRARFEIGVGEAGRLVIGLELAGPKPGA